MKSKIIRMGRAMQGNLTEVAATLRKEMLVNAELVAENSRAVGDGQTIMLNFEKYYLRNGSYATLAVLLTDFGGIQTADIVGSGGGNGIFNISWGANSEFADDAAGILRQMGFEED